MINAILRKFGKTGFGIEFTLTALLFHFPQRICSSACFPAFLTTPLSAHRTGHLAWPQPLSTGYTFDSVPNRPVISDFRECGSRECCSLILRDARRTQGAIPTSMRCCEVQLQDISKMLNTVPGMWYLFNPNLSILHSENRSNLYFPSHSLPT